MPYSESQKRASRKYNEENYARINLYLSPAEKERWKAEADKKGIALSVFIKECVKQQIERVDD